MIEENEELSLKLFAMLSHVYRKVMDQVAKDIRSHGLNPTEFDVLELLYHKGEQPIKQIGDKVFLASGSMTYVIDKLEEKGLICRKPCPEDRRVIYAVVTDKGMALIEMIFPSHRQAIAKLLDGLDEGGKRTCMELLQKIRF